MNDNLNGNNYYLFFIARIYQGVWFY